MKQLQKLYLRIDEQLDWIDEHGASREAYIRRYGSAKDPEHYGSGGEAIWEADYQELEKLMAQVAALKGRK